MTTYRASWPVTDPRTPLADIIGAASHDLGIMLAAEKLEQSGPVEWRITYRNRLMFVAIVPVGGDDVRTTATESKPRKPAVPAYRPCGTHAAFTRHKSRCETPCAECVEAERDYQRARHERRKASALLRDERDQTTTPRRHSEGIAS